MLKRHSNNHAKKKENKKKELNGLKLKVLCLEHFKWHCVQSIHPKLISINESLPEWMAAPKMKKKIKPGQWKYRTKVEVRHT